MRVSLQSFARLSDERWASGDSADRAEGTAVVSAVAMTGGATISGASVRDDCPAVRLARLGRWGPGRQGAPSAGRERQARQAIKSRNEGAVGGGTRAATGREMEEVQMARASRMSVL